MPGLNNKQDTLGGAGVIIGTVAIDQTTPGTTNGVVSTPFAPIVEMGLTELIGINEAVAQNQYGASVGVALGGTYSGELLNIALYSSEDDTGQIIAEAGRLYVFDADPTVAAGDANLAAADWPTMIAAVDIAAGDWKEEAAGGLGATVSMPTTILFHPLATLYFAYYHQGATTWNDAAGDDEQLELNVWYRRDS